MDKRRLAELFKERVSSVMEQSGDSQGAFARSAGLDRSAFSQMMSRESVRLPRAETLRQIAEGHSVSIDWLLGLNNEMAKGPTVERSIKIEGEVDARGESPLQSWHKEAEGYKIRYVPSRLPDLLLHQGLKEEESFEREVETVQLHSEAQLAYSRLPETDIESCMPMQRIIALARGEGVWAEVEQSLRREQLLHMAELIRELYPRFRLFLYDESRTFSGAYTVFGPLRAAIYMGGVYVVVSTVDHVRALSSHFDDLIKAAVITPERAERFVLRQARQMD